MDAPARDVTASGFGADRFGWTDDALAELRRVRGWTEPAIERLELTYDPGSGVVGIPIRDDRADELGRLTYNPRPANGRPKMQGPAGVPRQLFPPPELIRQGVRDVLLVEGEPDAVAAWSAGLAAVGVPGTNGWRREWAARFRGPRWRVHVVFDCDEVGRRAAAEVAGSLLELGVDVRVLDLAPARDDGYDLTDYLLERGAGAVRELMAASELYSTADADERILLPYHELRARHEREDATDWIWAQLIAPGYLTRVDGRPKIAGKSTLLFALCAAIRNGQPFLGFNTRPATVAYCSEQRWPALHQKLILPFGAPPYMHLYYDEPLDLAGLVGRLIDETEQLGVELVVIDTVGRWLRLPQGGRFDPDLMAGQMALLEQLSQRVAVVVADYTKKGEAPRGEATLGATEQTGRADILIELKRPDPDLPNVRRLEVTGRSDAPEEIDYRLTPDGTLEPVDLDELKGDELSGALLAELRRAIEAGEGAPSGSELARRLERRKADVLAELENLAAQGRVYTLGRGRSQVWAITGTDTGTESGTDTEDEFGGLF